MKSWAQLFDKAGNIRAEVDGVFTRSSLLNAVGKAEFTQLTKSRKTLDKNFHPGNFIVIYHSDLPDPWVGKIIPDANGGIERFKFQAASAETQFYDRTGALRQTVGADTAPAGQIYKDLIPVANADEDTLLREGEIYLGGAPVQCIVSHRSLGLTVEALMRKSGEEYSVTPDVNNNKLTLLANWHKQRGSLQETEMNRATCEFPDDAWARLGPIWNQINAIGDPDETDPANVIPPPIYSAKEPASSAKYYLAVMFLHVSATDLPTVAEEANANLAKYAWPVRRVKVRVRSGKKLMRTLRVGNTYPLNEKFGFNPSGTVGVDTAVRLLGWAHTDGDKGIEVTVKEVAAG